MSSASSRSSRFRNARQAPQRLGSCRSLFFRSTKGGRYRTHAPSGALAALLARSLRQLAGALWPRWRRLQKSAIRTELGPAVSHHRRAAGRAPGLALAEHLSQYCDPASPQPLLSRPSLQLGSTDQDSRDRQPRYTDEDKRSWLVTYHQALAVMKTNACRVEVAFVGSHLAATASRVDAVVDFPCLLKHGGQSLQSLTLSGVTVDRLLKYYDEGLPLKELTLMGCSCNSSVGQHNTLGDRQNVLAALKQLQDLQTLSLITTDVCSVRGLSKHPSLTSLTVGGEKWRHDDEDYMCSDDEDDDDIHSPDGMPDLAGIYKIPKLTHLDLSVGLEFGNTKGGFKVTPDYYRLIGKCTALTTLEIPVSGGDGVLLSKYLTRCPRLERSYCTWAGVERAVRRGS